MLHARAIQWTSGRTLAWVLLMLLALPLPTARAQSCHTPSLRTNESENALGYRAAVSSVLASFTRADFAGEYQALAPSFGISHPWLVADVALPMYRLTRDAAVMHGVGDLAADLRVSVYRNELGTFAWGAELAATLPTGSAAKGLGMGHVMLMPGGWIALRVDRLSLLAQLAYARALTSLAPGQHQHAGGGVVGPLVNPMNPSELEHALALSYALHPNLSAIARLLGAVPIHSFDGQAREVIALGLQAIAGPLDVALELQLPVIGEPFDAKTTLAVALQW